MFKGKGEDVFGVMVEVLGIGDELKVFVVQFDVVQVKMQDLMLLILNLLYESVLVGCDEMQNVEVCCEGMLCVFDFLVKDYVDLGVVLGLDFDVGVKLLGV